MDNKRHCIAVILSEVCEVYQTQLIEGIKKRAAQSNYNVAVFASFFSKRFDSPLNEIGENNIFALINYDMFDGFIVLPNAINNQEVYDSIMESLKKTKKPVVFIDKESDDFHSVCSDDRETIRMVTNHLIKDHGLTRINCLTGYKGLNLSENRLQGYKDALIENNIEVEDQRYDYGDFWREAPVKFVEHMFTCGLELPQAVVCANDTMAITVCDELKARGIRVPEDIAVYGFDRIIEGKLNVPQIASVAPAMAEIGTKSVELILKILNGEKVDKTNYVPGKLFPSQSCGCQKLDYEEEKAAEITRLSHYTELTQHLINSIYMSENLQESQNVDEIFMNLSGYMFLLKDIQTLHIFLCEGWDVLHDNKVHTPASHLSGYSDTVINKFKAAHVSIDCPEMFQSSQMFPPLFDNSMPPDVYFFFPINFQDTTMGYAVCSCQGESYTPDAIFRNWLKYLSNALGYLRSKQHLHWALKRLERVSEMDSLTGVYNRYGYENRIHHMFETAKSESKDFLVIMGDLDCLKMINDNYGHTEGDNAIRIIAKAFQNSFTEDEVCARIGGDEFIMFGTGQFDSEKLKKYPVRIKEYLDHYNQNSSKPYIIGISIGMYCNKVSESSVLQDWLDKADENMYVNKKGKVKVYRKTK